MILYNTYFWRALNRVDRVVIIGWGAGDVDLPYLRKIQENVDVKTVWNASLYLYKFLIMEIIQGIKIKVSETGK